MRIPSARIPEGVRFAALAASHETARGGTYPESYCPRHESAGTMRALAREELAEDLVVPVVRREVAGVGPHAEVDVWQVLE